MEWMSAIDSSFLHIENAATPMHIGGVSIFEGPAPAFAQLEAMVAGKLALVPRYRQKVRFVPLGLGRPVWVDEASRRKRAARSARPRHCRRPRAIRQSCRNYKQSPCGPRPLASADKFA